MPSRSPYTHRYPPRRNSLLAVALLLSSLAPLAAQPAAKPKTAVIDLAKVMSKYDKHIEFKKKIEEELVPLKAQAEKIKQSLAKLKTEAEDPSASPEIRDIARHNFKVELSKLNQLDKDAKEDLGKRIEVRNAELWKETHAAVAKHAEATGIDVVIAYGDIPNQPADEVPNVKRRMNAIDVGAGILFYARPGLDITDAIVARLNDAYRAAQKKKP
jgi:Skp family chaperone for outer membrane proteins